MIRQIASVKPKTEALPPIKQVQPALTPAAKRSVWSPMTSGPFMVPVTRWIE
jgi:hypothetical protein